MKFDMHCHTHEGSPDSNVSVEQYIKLLLDQGFDGMLMTDHNSYRGYRFWKKNLKDKKFKDFVVLRGIEYDTFDAGHFIVVLPSGDESRLMEKRGMSLVKLIDVVHSHGGILGPAHPYGESFMSIYRSGRFKKDKSITKEFDFLEGYNSCEDDCDNDRAKEVAEEYGKQMFSGTDAHRASNVGKAATYFDGDIRSEDDLIKYMKEGGKTSIEGERWYGTTKDHLGPFNKLLVWGFFPFNKAGALARTIGRTIEYKKFTKS